MSYLSIEGGAPLHGELTIQGSKNSVLPVLAATILARDVCRIENCPRLRDVDASVAILRHLGRKTPFGAPPSAACGATAQRWRWTLRRWRAATFLTS